MPHRSALFNAILEGDAKAAAAAARIALERGEDPLALIAGCMMPAMEEVGSRFETEKYFVPEMLLAARAMKSALEPLRPQLRARGVQPVGRVVVGTVRGDLHDIGKNLVASMLEGNGFEVTDLGTDVAPESFIAAIRNAGANVLALSSLLTVTMVSMAETIRALEKAGLRDRVKVLVGGAPVTQRFASQIGADGYSEHAGGAAALARRLLCAAGETRTK